ncbi:Nif3-like dinuclear metal center hexameric protein [Enterococcus thailandicus]|uniref:Nif3-like dinuclear metal center hexameric protein n=1 Tax=Enterococcus TaxID=1350 RepID=UPI00094CF63F|nr:Nif3-like dinuclear metal center hexameric protein [Enterococcus thailandicus]GMB99780.1 GTP cyclohydrolase 1 type 2 [Enterococcus thailandicus]
MINAQTFINRFEQYCPQWLAEEGDPVGLQIGTLNKPIQRVMMTLDVRPEVVEEAIAKKIDLLIAKHPPIFRPIKQLTTDEPQEKMYTDLLKHDIAVYAAHTNMDIIWDGLNDWFCERLGIQVENYLVKTHEVGYKKLAVYLPVEDATIMREALANAGAGQLGEYSGASFTSVGQGRFTPSQQAHPAIGTSGKAEKVQEAKVEVVFPETIEKTILQVMREHHPYEEIAYDLFSIDAPAQSFGLGRVGTLPKQLDLTTFIEKVKIALQVDDLRVVVPSQLTEPRVQRIAICGGSGEKFYPSALKQGADVYITGDLYYHTAQDMQSAGLIAIDPGHYIESLCKEKFVEKFESWKQEEQWDLDFFVSETNTNPFQFH